MGEEAEKNYGLKTIDLKIRPCDPLWAHLHIASRKRGVKVNQYIRLLIQKDLAAKEQNENTSVSSEGGPVVNLNFRQPK